MVTFCLNGRSVITNLCIVINEHSNSMRYYTSIIGQLLLLFAAAILLYQREGNKFKIMMLDGLELRTADGQVLSFCYTIEVNSLRYSCLYFRRGYISINHCSFL